MAWRKWLVRLLVFSITAAIGTAGFLYHHWTNPTVVREQVIQKITSILVGANLSLDSAQWRLLGGISLTDLKLARKEDPEQTDVISVPSAVIFPDKEKVLNGKLAIRKVELYRPRLYLRRNRDGRWNTAHILGPVHPEEAIPTISIEHGTILLQDQMGENDGPSMEIKDVQLTLINDPLPTINIEGNGTSNLGAKIRISGTWQRLTDEVSISLRLDGLPIGAPLIEQLGSYCPNLVKNASQVQADAALTAEFTYSPKSVRPWNYNIRCQFANGKLSHPSLPLKLSDLEATIRCVDGQPTLEKMTARAGSAVVTASGFAQELRPETDFDFSLSVQHLPINSEVFSKLPASLQTINEEFAPTGPVSLTYQCARHTGKWHKHCVLRPENMAASFISFPYPLERITGILEQQIDSDEESEILQIDLVGWAGSQQILIKGNVAGAGSGARIDLKVSGNNLPLDEKLQAALPPLHQTIARAFHPTGFADFEAYIHHSPGNPSFANNYRIHFHHATAHYDVFPYPLENVEGILDIRPEGWEFSAFQGVHKGCHVQTSGRSISAQGGNRLAIDITGDNLLLDSELESALQPELKQAWKIFEPTGRMKFRAHVDCLPNQPPDASVTINPLRCNVKPAFFSYRLDDVTGVIHYAKRWVHVEKLSARHGPMLLTIDRGQVYIKPEGGVWADISSLGAAPLIPDREFIEALPSALRNACRAIEFKDPLELATRLTVTSFPNPEKPPDIFWDGKLILDHANINAGVPLSNIRGEIGCKGRYNQTLEGLVGNAELKELTVFNQPFRDIHSGIEVRKDAPTVLVLPGLYARIFGGELYGPVRFEFGPELRFELNLMASQIRLEEFARHNLGRTSQVSGLANGSLYLTGQGSDPSKMTGKGSIDVPNGRLYTLPVLLDLLKFLNLRLPDGTAFEEAHAAFSVRGKVATIRRLDLYGNPISLRGQGEMKLDGSNVNLDLYAIWGARAVQWLPPVIKEIPPYISQHLLKIKLRGSMNEVHFDKEPVPVLVEPIKDLLQRMASAQRN